MMLTTWMLFLIPIATCQEVYESTEDTQSSYNITTLYPVNNKTIDKITTKDQRNNTEPLPDNFKANVIEKENDKLTSDEEEDIQEIRRNQNTDRKEKLDDVIPRKENISSWKVDATYQPKKTNNEDSNRINSKERLMPNEQKSKIIDKEKEFKPSPHLGSFFDDENLSLLKITTPEFVVPEKKPTLDFIGSKDLYVLNYKSPKDTYRDQIDAPYKFENTYFKTSNWKQTLDSKPTVESPIKIPAGGLYKHSNPFKEKPGLNGDDEDFGLSFSEDGKEKENPVKKRSNPWKHFLHLVTAFLPVGLIISALTPNVITIHSANDDPHVNRFSRRSGGGFADVPPISERCKRRLLCEIHSEENYLTFHDKSSGYVRKHCYKIRCEDPQALNRVLRWLLAHQPGTAHPPGALQPTFHPQHQGSQQVQYRNQDIMQHHHRSGDFT